MEQQTSSQEYPDDYIEIVNEINDFIASLTGTSADASASSGSQSEEVYLRDSLENDYEPIESLPSPPPSAVYLAPPTPPRPYIRVMAEGAPKHVKALHNFKGTNNDELCFSKGDIITVTQVMEGGWWEGTLNGKTGWFPSNYAKEVRTDMPSAKAKGSDVTAYKRESMQIYHNVVLKNIIETERAHVAEISRVLQTYILPLKNAGILSAAEYSLIAGNLEEIEAFQTKFLAALEECEKLPPLQRRVGGIFMKHAQQLKDLYRDYCANHPQAVAVLQRRRDDLSRFMESQGAQPPGAMTLTTHLSKPFTRLERYPSLLKELERHIEESHPDRGDTQRAIAVYRDIANSCMEIRKLKEMEYEIITSTIHGWEGEEISKLGEVLHLSQVKVHRQTGEKYDRIFVLFSNVLVMLSMSPRLSGYQYEGILPLSGMMVNKCEDAENFMNGFELSGTMIDKMIVTCGTKIEVASWLDVLSHQVKQSHNVVSSTKPQSLQVSTSQPSISTVTVQAKTAKVMHSPQPKTNKVWNTSCLRPAPPLRPTLMCREDALKSPRTGRKSTQKRKPVRTYSGDEYAWRRYDPKVYNEDAFILEVIEAYCNSAKTRHTVNSCRRITSPDPRNLKAILNAPQVLIADEEKIIDDSGDQEKTLVDTVYSLKDKVRALEQEQKKLKKELEDERKARKKLESYVRQTVGSGMMDHTKDNGAT